MQENEKKIVDNIKKQEENENDEFFDNNTLDIESSLLYIEENEKRILKNKEIDDFVEKFIDKLDFLCAGAMVLGPQYHGSGGEKTTPDYYIFN